MTFQGALIREHGVSFAIVVVKRHVLDNRTESSEMIAASSQFFGGVPTVLMAQEAGGRPRYLGRPDIVRFLASISPARIPWKRFTTP